MSLQRYKFAFYVPIQNAEAVKAAVHATGAGRIGNYSHCSWTSTPGTGQFTPLDGANPAIGAVGKPETVEEVKVEMMIEGEEQVRAAVRELKKVHPYEEVAYDVWKLENF
ncbi:hypothetical protein YB2330_001518 [Saitoella coloradoensis]